MSSKRDQHTAASSTAGGAEYRDVDVKELKAALERARAVLSVEDYALLTGAVDTFTALTRELQLKGATLERLRRLFLGGSTEKTKKVLGNEEKEGDDKSQGESASSTGASEEKPKAKGHGRNGAAAYSGATRKTVAHEALHGGDSRSPDIPPFSSVRFGGYPVGSSIA